MVHAQVVQEQCYLLANESEAKAHEELHECINVDRLLIDLIVLQTLFLRDCHNHSEGLALEALLWDHDVLALATVVKLMNSAVGEHNFIKEEDPVALLNAFGHLVPNLGKFFLTFLLSLSWQSLAEDHSLSLDSMLSIDPSH